MHNLLKSCHFWILWLFPWRGKLPKANNGSISWLWSKTAGGHWYLNFQGKSQNMKKETHIAKWCLGIFYRVWLLIPAPKNNPCNIIQLSNFQLLTSCSFHSSWLSYIAWVLLFSIVWHREKVFAKHQGHSALWRQTEFYRTRHFCSLSFPRANRFSLCLISWNSNLRTMIVW